MRKIYFNLFCFSVWQWQVTGWAKWFKDLKTLIQLVTPSITSLSLELFIPLTLTQLIALFGVAWAVRRYKHGRRRWRARKPPWSWQPTHDHREKCSLSCDWSVSGDPGPWLVRWEEDTCLRSLGTRPWHATTELRAASHWSVSAQAHLWLAEGHDPGSPG